MGQRHFNPKDFMAVEEHVHDRSIETMPVEELTRLKVSLVKNAPTAAIERAAAARPGGAGGSFF